MNPSAIYRRLAGIPGDPHFALPAIEWLVYFNIDDQRNPAEIAAALRLPEAEIVPAIDRLIESGLIEERPVSLAEFLRSKSAYDNLRSAAAVPLGAALRRQIPEDDPPAPAAQPYPGAATEEAPSSDTHSHPFEPEPFQPLEPATMDATTQNRPISLLRLMDYIMSQSSDRTSGQLAVYRVFMGINTALLRRNGITSLRFSEDRVIDDPELLSALSDSLQRALGLPFPESAYVTA